MKEEIRYCASSDFIEKLAHESAMATAIAEFNKSFKADGIVPTQETAYIINSYYKHKKRILNELSLDYTIKNI